VAVGAQPSKTGTADITRTAGEKNFH